MYMTKKTLSCKVILIKRLPSFARHSTILYKKSIKFSIYQASWIPNFIDFLYKMAEDRQAIEGKPSKLFCGTRSHFLKIK